MKFPVLPVIPFVLALTACKPAGGIHPERKTIVDAVFGSGHLENNNQYTITANTEGYIKKAFVTEGDTVTAGRPLFRLQNEVQQTQENNAAQNLQYARENARQGSAQLQQLEIQIGQAAQKLQVDSLNYQRFARLVQTKAVAAADYENARLNYQHSVSSLRVLEKNRIDLQHTLQLNVDNARAGYHIQQATNAYYVLSSRDAGVVMNVNKKTGDFVRKGDPLAVLGTGSLIIKLDIAEGDISKVKAGQRTLISLNSQPGKTYEAVITKVYPAFNANDQSFIAEAAFNTAPPATLNGTQLQANIIIQVKQQALVVPSYCIINDSYVLVKGSDSKKKVDIGIRTLEWTEITGGITGNDLLLAPNK